MGEAVGRAALSGPLTMYKKEISFESFSDTYAK